MNRQKLKLLVFISLGIVINTYAQSTFKLEEAVSYAIKNHPSVKNAIIGTEDAKLQILEIKKSGLPQINGQFAYSANVIVPSQLIDVSNFDTKLPKGTLAPVKFGLPWGGQTGISVNQLLFNASWLVGLRAADTYKKMAAQELDKSIVVVAENVKKAYYSALVTEQRAKILDINIARIDSVIYQTEQFFKQGFVEKIDIDRLNVQKNNLVTEKQKLDNLITLTYQLLKFQMSYPIDAQITLTETLEKKDVDAIKSVIIGQVDSRNRVEYNQLETSIMLTNLNIERLRKSRIPSLAVNGTLGAGHSNSVFNPFENWFGSSSLTLAIQIPIYDSGLNQVLIRRQKLNIMKIENGANLLKESFVLENEQAKINLKNGFEGLDIQSRNMTLAEEVLKVSKIKYQQGVGSNLEVVNAESDLKQAQNNYFSALYDVLIAKVDLDKAQGQLIKK